MMKSQSFGAIIVLLVCYIHFAKETDYTPIAYTLPDGLQSVNGSSSTGGCQPESCVMMPIGSSTINGCDCPGKPSVNGTLIDGVIPSIDTTQQGWASELFTVNRNGQDSIKIGFQFLSEFYLRGIEIVLFHCPVQGIGVAGINAYSSFLFPAFISTASSLLVTHSSSPSDNCQSLSAISIPVQPPMAASNNYFIEFLFTGGSSVHQFNWLHLGEIRFSDEAPMMEPTTVIEITTTDNEAQPEPNTTNTTVYPSTTSSLSTKEILSISITRDVIGDTLQPSVYTTTSSSHKTFDFSSTTPILLITNSESGVTTLTDSNPPTITVTVLAGVIGLLILLMVGGCGLLLCFVCYRRHKLSLREGPWSQYALPTELILHEKRSSLPTAANSAYNRHSSRMTLELPDLPETDYSSPELYSEVGIDGDSGLYDDIGANHYALISEAASKAESGPRNVNSTTNTMSNHDNISPYETPRLSKCIDEAQKQADEVDQLPQIPTSEGQTAPIIGIYSQVEENTQELQGEREYYTDMRGEWTASQLSVCSRHSSCDSVPLLQLSKPLGHGMEDNPTYNSAWSLLGENEKQPLGHEMEDNPMYNSAWSLLGENEKEPLSHNMEDNPMYNSSSSLLGENEKQQEEEDTYADPDAGFDEGSQQTIYETVYSDSQVKSAIFKRNDAAEPNGGDVTDTVEQESIKESSEEDEEKKATLMYTSVYLSHDASSHTSQKQPLAITDDNIRAVKVLGTGFFGKVILADTVGLSLKDLGLSDTDDNKSTSIRVAVKKLKQNASKSTREAFEKECRFMSRLDHPNVMHILGVCKTEPSQFIMMEYMERGDLNGYLEEYTSMVPGRQVLKEGEIHISTLVYMCTQIAAAMNYLVSHNFIHRDLAARNCLVGDENTIKLADFGMSRNLYESHYYLIQGNAVLPVRWMASECFYGKFSAKTDVWAFGVTMWEIFMLAKERPYPDMEDMEVVDDAIEKEERTLLSQPDDCPDDVFQVMMRCWAKEPKDRATFEELHAMLIQLNN